MLKIYNDDIKKKGKIDQKINLYYCIVLKSLKLFIKKL